MAKVYFVRHQAAGVVWKFPFSEHPTETQVAAVAKDCFHDHGFGHSKTPDEPYWTTVVEVDVLGAEDAPTVRERSLSVVSAPGVAAADAPQLAVSGSGTVTPAGG